jgi:hypothetical protein
MIAIFLRGRMYKETDKSKELRLGTFRFPSSPAVQQAADSLYDLLLEKRGEPQLSELGPPVHTLSRELLLYSSSSNSHKIGGPSDFVLMLQSLRPDGNFDNNASIVTKACSQLQYVLRSIFVHCRRLKGANYLGLSADNTEGTLDDGDPISISDAIVFMDNDDDGDDGDDVVG